jgi:predicted PurR-regulated permease PerM
MFYVLLSPLHHRLIKKLDMTTFKGIILKNLWAALFAIGTVVLILVPLFFLGSQFFKQIIDLTHLIRDTFYTKPGILQDMFGHITGFILDISAGQVSISPDDMQRRIVSLLSLGLENLLQFSSGVARNVGSFFLSLALMLFTLFFFYVDGAYLSRLFLRVIPIRKQYLSTLVGKFMDITRNLFLGYIMVALIQTLMSYIIFIIFQINGALVFAVLTFICVFIPMIGGGVVWLPLGIFRIMGGDVLGGAIFLIVSAVFISTLDNFLRPLFLHNRIQLHPLIIFFAILGGLRTFGFNGLILGPMLVILFLTVLDLFLTEHRMETD